jgi:SAM-dependent methyltransferase
MKMEGADRSNVGASYDEVAASYAAEFSDELDHKPLDRALLSMLADEAQGGVVADLGCGPGHVASWLADRGASTVGVDLSPGMVAEASRLHSHLEFRVGDLCDLPADDGEFAAAAVLYAIIHLAPAELGPAMRELRRVLAPGGLALVSFHIGTEVVHRTEWWGHRVDLDFRFYPIDEVVDAAVGVGFDVEARIERSPHAEEVATRRAYLLLRRPE